MRTLGLYCGRSYTIFSGCDVDIELTIIKATMTLIIVPTFQPVHHKDEASGTPLSPPPAREPQPTAASYGGESSSTLNR